MTSGSSQPLSSMYQILKLKLAPHDCSGTETDQQCKVTYNTNFRNTTLVGCNINSTSALYKLFSAINGRMLAVVYFKGNEYNITNNYMMIDDYR